MYYRWSIRSIAAQAFQWRHMIYPLKIRDVARIVITPSHTSIYMASRTGLPESVVRTFF